MAGSTTTAVKLISGNGFCFIIDKEVAEQSPTLKYTIDTSRGGIDSDVAFAEALTNQIQLPEIRGRALDKSVPEFDFGIEVSLELLMAADYLEC
ncbi:hypothetical protein IWW49_001894 [Coemansia sp. RSA 1797]|nr:hypothetical protein GGH97_000365 [Coemansia sp. RSA 475]KAJ2256431.1 hypothetical protein GGH98_001515 [Coemansia sp. RSA 454]KAJ2590698.1 hypothetical protein IWW49_001894 [Coemansia sp. RSA 1797]